MLRRGAEIFAFGLLFRLQEFLIAWGWAPWSDLLRVDVLNIIGLSMRHGPACVGTGVLTRPSRAYRGPRQERCWLGGVE
jgi:hypothetical protein